jgi:hypothetical protein
MLSLKASPQISHRFGEKLFVCFSVSDFFRQAQMVELSHLEQLQKMAWFAHHFSFCRRVMLYQHFNEPFDQRNCHGKCDNCLLRAATSTSSSSSSLSADSRARAQSVLHRLGGSAPVTIDCQVAAKTIVETLKRMRGPGECTEYCFPWIASTLYICFYLQVEWLASIESPMNE